MICCWDVVKVATIFEVPVNIILEFLNDWELRPAQVKTPVANVARFCVVGKFTPDDAPDTVPTNEVDVNAPVDGLYVYGPVVSSI